MILCFLPQDVGSRSFFYELFIYPLSIFLSLSHDTLEQLLTEVNADGSCHLERGS